MADLSVTNSFSPNTVAASGEVNTNFTDVETWLNNRNAGSDTWGYMKVAATVANPVDITSTAATTELSISNSATDGDPILSFELGGTAAFTLGVDDGDSDLFKIGTTAIGTSTSVTISGTTVTFKGIGLFQGASAAAPSMAFEGDADTGFYRVGSNSIGFSAGGTAQWSMSDSIVSLNSGAVRSGDGLVGTPSYTFADDTDSGIYRIGANNIAVSVAGVLNTEWSTGGMGIKDGTVSAPSLFFSSDTDTGLYWGSAGFFKATTNGADAAAFSATSTVGFTRLQVYDVDNAQLEAVRVGAADSGGAGFKVLIIAN